VVVRAAPAKFVQVIDAAQVSAPGSSQYLHSYLRFPFDTFEKKVIPEQTGPVLDWSSDEETMSVLQ